MFAGRLAFLSGLTRGDVFNEVIRSHVVADVMRSSTFFRPGVMAILAIEFLFNHSYRRGEAERQVWDHRLVGELRIIDAKRVALGTPDGIGQALGCIPIEQYPRGLVELRGGNFKPDTRSTLRDKPEFLEPEFLMNFRRNSPFTKSMAKLLCIGPLAKMCHKQPHR